MRLWFTKEEDYWGWKGLVEVWCRGWVRKVTNEESSWGVVRLVYIRFIFKELDFWELNARDTWGMNDKRKGSLRLVNFGVVGCLG